MRARAQCWLAMILIGLTAGTIYGQEGWQLKHAEGADLSAVFALSWPPGSKSDDSLEWLWVGDNNGFLQIVRDPDDNNFFNVDRIPVAFPKTAAAPNRKQNPVDDIYFRDPKNGFLLEGNVIYLSHSGGLDWRADYPVPAKDGASANLYSISFFPNNPKRGCIVGAYTRGTTIVNSLVLCGEDRFKNDRIFWEPPQPLPVHGELLHLDLVDDRRGWIVGAAGTILHTEDGGRSWQEQDSNTRAALFHVAFSDARHGWVVGQDGTILRTSDGGRNWQEVSPDDLPDDLPKDATFMSVKFTDSQHGWVVGYKGLILYTSDGGARWRRQDSRTKEDLYALFVDGKYCWAVGGSGVMLRYRR